MDSRATNAMEDLEDMKGFAHIMNLLFSFVQPMVLRCMVQLGLPDIINNHGRALTLTQLSRALPFESVDSDRLHRILHHSVRMGLFTVDVTCGEPTYGLAPACKFLLRDAATSISPLVLGVTDETALSPYQFLSAWLDGKVRVTPWELKHGRAPWEMLAGEPELNRTFREGMAALTRAEFSAVVRDGKGAFEGVGSLVDVGGGTGMAARSIVKAFPHIECIVLDLPEFVAQATESSGVTFIAGDMFAFIPPTHTVFLKNVLHDWSDTDCVKILKQCKEAIAKKGGKIIIVDIVLEEGAEDMFDNLRLAMDLGMAVMTGGRERTKREWETLLQTAGLDISKITHTSSSQSIIENVLHDWSDTDCVKILKQCKEAIAKKGGKIIIVDIVLEEGAEDMFDNLRLAMDLNMAVMTRGRERTKGEWETLLQTAGSDISKITHTSSSQSIIEAYPN